MAASINWYDTDDTTLLTSVDQGTIPPGTSYFQRVGAYRQLRVKNDGTETFTTVNVEIQQAGTYDGYTHQRIAPDATGSAGTFQDHTSNPLALGALAVGAVEPVWLDTIVPVGALAEAGQTSNLVLLATL